MADWRLTNQEKYLKGATLRFLRYRQPRADWDHDLCEFCWAKFAESEGAGILHEGYATTQDNRWICRQCFADFKDLFGWKVEALNVPETLNAPLAFHELPASEVAGAAGGDGLESAVAATGQAATSSRDAGRDLQLVHRGI